MENNIGQGLQTNPPVSHIPVHSGELPKARQILNEAWEIYKGSFKTLIIVGLLPTLVTIVLTAIFVGGGIAGMALSINTRALGLVGIILGIAAILFVIYVNVWGAIALIYAIKDRADNLTWKEAYKRSKAKIGAFFLTALLAGLATMGGLILLVIPGIIIALWFSQSSYIVAEENLEGTAALKRSKYYIKGRMGEVFLKFLYIIALSIGLVIILNIILSMVGLNDKQLDFASNILSVFWGPLTLAYCYQLYKHLKATRP